MSSPSFLLLQGDPSDWGVPPSGKTYIGLNDSGQIVTKQHDGTVTVIGTGGTPSLNKQANSDGSVITVTPTTTQHREVITLSGIARTQVVNISGTDLADGSVAVLQLNMPSTPGIIVEFYSDSVLLFSYQNESGVLEKARFEIYKDGSAWEPGESTVPAYTPAS